jgi:hypothetical protein
MKSQEMLDIEQALKEISRMSLNGPDAIDAFIEKATAIRGKINHNKLYDTYAPVLLKYIKRAMGATEAQMIPFHSNHVVGWQAKLGKYQACYNMLVQQESLFIIENQTNRQYSNHEGTRDNQQSIALGTMGCINPTSAVGAPVVHIIEVRSKL